MFDPLICAMSSLIKALLLWASADVFVRIWLVRPPVPTGMGITCSCYVNNKLSC